MRIFHLVELYEHPVVPPLDDEVRVDLDGEVSVVDLQDLEVVEADGDVQGLDHALAEHGDRGDVSRGEESRGVNGWRKASKCRTLHYDLNRS